MLMAFADGCRCLIWSQHAALGGPVCKATVSANRCGQLAPFLREIQLCWRAMAAAGPTHQAPHGKRLNALKSGDASTRKAAKPKHERHACSDCTGLTDVSLGLGGTHACLECVLSCFAFFMKAAACSCSRPVLSESLKPEKEQVPDALPCQVDHWYVQIPDALDTSPV
ncbi:unnamed protein product [Effrenium voratum]|nr:unnamed protein product [Effrenium voratum]